MTDKQINEAIAKACGWKLKKNYWLTPEGIEAFSWDIPNYCNDLNAMHEAEKHIPDSLVHIYGNKIGTVTGAEDSSCLSFYGATARQLQGLEQQPAE